MRTFTRKRGEAASSLRGWRAGSFLLLFFFFALLAGCFSKSSAIDQKDGTFSSKEAGLTVTFPPEWRLSEQKNTLFVAEHQSARISLARLTVTDEKEIPRIEDYLKLISFQSLAQRMQKVSQGEISHFQTVSAGKKDFNGRTWEETVWAGARNDQPKVFHTYATPVGLNIVQFHFEFPVTFYNNPEQFINPVLEGVATHPPERPDADYARIYRASGEFYKSMKLWPDAIAAFKEALSRKPKDADLHALLGESYFQNQEIELALNEFLKAAQLSPQNPRAQHGLADVYFKKGMPDQAIPALRRAVNLSPDNASLYIKLGNAYLDQGKSEEAIQAFHKLIRRNPKAAEAHLGLGKAYLKMDLFEQAGLELEQALRLQPNVSESHCLLEKVYNQLASEAEAQKEKALCEAGDLKPS